ncbi:hypothetical protein E2C01_060406 [Portunus trituberculatus]|uniref:Uncharacterized protein n=1 Tax=Portunus trituberculatus TaxID=210409 RepID=A0A5B7H8S6_PORTR|nr:hypothetical protein [Portunus trituberculatus]
MASNVSLSTDLNSLYRTKTVPSANHNSGTARSNMAGLDRGLPHTPFFATSYVCQRWWFFTG